MAENHLIIFMRYPEPGKVKTRLSKDAGNENGVKLYRCFVETLLKRVSMDYLHKQDKENKSGLSENRYDISVFFTPENERNKMINWLGAGYEFYAQFGDDLGERILNAFNVMFDKGAKKVVIIGSDAPTLDAKLMTEAFKGLNQHDVVIGPARDGGYYLIGLSFISKKITEYWNGNIFSNVEWDSGKVYNQTVGNLKSGGFTFTLLPELYDIDVYEDLFLLENELSRTDDLAGEHFSEIYDLLKGLRLERK